MLVSHNTRTTTCKYSFALLCSLCWFTHTTTCRDLCTPSHSMIILSFITRSSSQGVGPVGSLGASGRLSMMSSSACNQLFHFNRWLWLNCIRHITAAYKPTHVPEQSILSSTLKKRERAWNPLLQLSRKITLPIMGKKWLVWKVNWARPKGNSQLLSLTMTCFRMLLSLPR